MEFNSELLQFSLLQFKPIYNKMLLVNLTSDSYTPIIISDSEWEMLKDRPCKTLSSYLNWFAHSDLIHADDKQKFLNLASTLHVRNNFLCYRRLMNNEWHWVLLRLFPSLRNTAEYILTVQDIHQEYDRVVDIIGTTDAMTGLYNKLAFERDSLSCKTGFVGVVFGDLNGLKYTNDNYGHAEGDKLIKHFAKLLRDNFRAYNCYHISGDEFVVAGYNIKIHEFLSDVLSFHKGLWDNEDSTPPIAALGYSAGIPQDIKAITACAEKAMYEDKQKFYTKFPRMARK